MTKKPQPDPRVDLGVNIYMAFRETLMEDMEKNGYITNDDRAVVYASFLSSIAAQMVVMAGLENTQRAMDLVKKAVTYSVRSSMQVVKL